MTTRFARIVRRINLFTVCQILKAMFGFRSFRMESWRLSIQARVSFSATPEGAMPFCVERGILEFPAHARTDELSGA